MTSSSSAVLIPVANKKGLRVDEGKFILDTSLSHCRRTILNTDGRLFLESWNEDAVKAAFDPSTNPADKPYIVYAASKTLGEQAAWKWIEEHNPQFIFNAVLPSFNVRINSNPDSGNKL